MRAHPCDIVPSQREVVLPRKEMVPPQSMPGKREPNQSMAQGGTSPKPNPESMHMEGEARLAMTQESMHALGVRTPNLDRRLTLYPHAG